MNEKLRGIMEKERVMISKRDESSHLQTGAWKRSLHVRLRRDGVMGKIILLLFILGVSLFALDTQTLLKAHKEALQTYQSKKDIYKSIALLKAAGIENILKEKPKEMTDGKYMQLLNDYGFFLQKSADFDHNVTLVLNGFPFIRNKRVETDERYLDSGHIKNFTQKTKNLCQSVNYFDRVIELSPKRSVAYLNLADTYWQLYLYENKISIDMGNIPNYVEQLGCKTFKKTYKTRPPKLISIFSNSYANLLARKSYLLYQTYAKLMQEQNQTEKIPSRVQDFLQRPKRYTVISDVSPATGDATVCQELQIAFDRFDCAECKDEYRDEANSKHPWLNRSIFELNPKFTRIYDRKINTYFHGEKVAMELFKNNEAKDFGYRYNNNIYIFGGGDYFDYWSQRIEEERGDGPSSVSKCTINYINLKQKNLWENEL